MKSNMLRNLLANLPATATDEALEAIVSSDVVRIERIVSQGHASHEGFWYDQEWHEFVVVLSGAARLEFHDSSPPLEMRAGDSIDIAAHRKHRVVWTTPDEPTVWLAVHYR